MNPLTGRGVTYTRYKGNLDEPLHWPQTNPRKMTRKMLNFWDVGSELDPCFWGEGSLWHSLSINFIIIVFIIIYYHQYSCSFMSNPLWPHGLQHARLPCPSELQEPTQTHVHRIGDAIQPSHPLSSPSPPAFNFSQHQGFFQWISSSHQVAEVLELQHQSFQWTFRTDFL